MDFTQVLQAITATLVAGAILGLIKLYGQVLILTEKVESQAKLVSELLSAHEELDTSRFVSLQEMINQIRLAITSLTNEKKKSR